MGRVFGEAWAVKKLAEGLKTGDSQTKWIGGRLAYRADVQTEGEKSIVGKKKGQGSQIDATKEYNIKQISPEL